MSMLEVERLKRSFGGLVAVRDVSFKVDEGDFLGLIGPNGAGKTTLFNVISGVLRPSAGTVRFLDRDISGQPANQTVRQGLSRTFQAATIYPEATVIENVIARHAGRQADRLVGRLSLAPMAGRGGREGVSRARPVRADGAARV